MNGPLGMDDWAAFSAGVSQVSKFKSGRLKCTRRTDDLATKAIGIVHVVMIMNGLSHGLGRSHQASSDSELEKAGEVCLPTL